MRTLGISITSNNEELGHLYGLVDSDDRNYVFHIQYGDDGKIKVISLFKERMAEARNDSNEEIIRAELAGFFSKWWDQNKMRLMIRGMVKSHMEFWTSVLSNISEKISETNYQTWFRRTSAEIVDETIIVKAKSEFGADWLEARYHSLKSEAVKEVSGQRYELKFVFTK